jgi:hypothetical protein
MMKNLLMAILTLAIAGSPAAYARQPASTPATQTEPNETDLQSHGHYTNKDGQNVHSPSKSKSGKAPDGASARCVVAMTGRGQPLRPSGLVDG